MVNEKDYPMTYKEFEKRITELFLEEHPNVNPDDFLEFIDSLKHQDNNNELLDLYHDSCYRYDAFGKDAFDDENFKNQPVRLLSMIYE